MAQQGNKSNPWSGFMGPNLGYVLELYDKYTDDPTSIDEETKELFDNWGPPLIQEVSTVKTSVQDISQDLDLSRVQKIIAAEKFAQEIRTYGHLCAKINPLDQEQNTFLEPSKYGINEDDLKNIPAHFIWADAPRKMHDSLQAINRLKEVYTNTLAYEFSHVHVSEERKWLTSQVESMQHLAPLSKEDSEAILKRLTEVEAFEKFLHTTFVGQKRFSIEGLDSLVPMLDELISIGVQDGAENVMIGMAHRGRLNVLAHVLGKPYEIIFSEFHHSPDKDLVPSEGSTGINHGWTGDVKYHLGADRKIKDDNVREACVTLANNPSHLEFIDPIVGGYARAAQEERNAPGFPKLDVTKAITIVIHGDAAFPGEGVVAETLNMGQLPGYTVGGTIHIIANNQLGFTAEKSEGRSTKYASDLAKGFEIPIVHVNADDPEACLAAIKLAHEYRIRFKKDFLIDLIGYRRFGHNEMDDPNPTQPKLYKIINNHPTVKEIYKNKLLQDNLIDNQTVQTIENDTLKRLQEAFENLKAENEGDHEELDPPEVVRKGIPPINTAVPEEFLSNINKNLLNVPDNFNVYPKLKRILERRARALAEEGKLDWSLSETMAFATILAEGTPIRLTGQDSERGTFAHRHIVLRDFETGERYSPLHGLPEAKASFAIHNSPLSETSVLGFEYGYNVFAPETLVLWEAQFGDFVNAGQVIIDQFISAGRAKWGQKSSIALLLPHGYEGQGPEHSSARIERFLTLAAESNWSVANVTTGAQYFHLLRRQAAICGKEEARPLVLMTPKGLIRNQKTVSNIEEFTNGSFKPVLEEVGLGKNPEQVKRIILCSGKIAVDLNDKLQEINDIDKIHILRIEQLYPFPEKEVREIVERYPYANEVVWVQEEPQNMGAWRYIEPNIREVTNLPLNYIGRPERSSPATGEPNVHKVRQERIVNEALKPTE
jgi:2-oxoglutarate dehydrogenase E1 component